jgi:cyclopropane-fatty-acyl-phospholipid synthase
VTSLTISRQSERFVRALIERGGLPCRVLFEHLYEHAPAERYDAIVNMGVTEHLPDYRRTLRAYERLLKPGGRVYLDACASRVKRDLSSFFRRFIYPGDNSPLCLHDYLRAVAASQLELRSVLEDRRNYLLTVRHWAERLEARREEIERRWGSAEFRRFRVFLWGCVDAFRRGALQAYRLVLELPA